MAKCPKRVDFTAEEVEALIARVENQQLEVADFTLLAAVIRAMLWLQGSLREKKLSITRLRSVFGIKTESRKRLLNLVKSSGAQASAEHANSSEENDASSSTRADTQKDDAAPANDAQKDDPPSKGHGHRASTDYPAAEIFKIAHDSLTKGSICPACNKGKLYNLSPGAVIRVVGQPWLNVQIYKPERLRCPICQKIFTARLPEEMYTGSRSDKAAKAIVSILKYRGGVPFYRQEQLQTILGAPISDTEAWGMTKELACCSEPIFVALCQAAANAECIHNDDTKALILDVMRENQRMNPERTGMFTTGILAKDKDYQVALFLTGRQHAGENLKDVLDLRDKELKLPIQSCDALTMNRPKGHSTQEAYCNAHARRNFYEIVSNWPKECLQIVSGFDLVFLYDQKARKDSLSAEERLDFHQKKSTPVMTRLKAYCNDLIEKKQVEPNSSLGKAIQYLDKYWQGLTLFLRVPGVPVSNNDNERLLKRAVLNRKNAYFFKSEASARIADTLMSIIETCVLNSVNPYDYLIALQEQKEKILKNPWSWLPWNYKAALNSS